MAVPDRPCSPIVVSLEDSTGRLGQTPAGWIRGELGRAIAHLGATGEVRVRVAGDAEVAEAHARYLGVAGTTDVITFDLAEGNSAAGSPLDADLLVCLDEAARQAGARGIAVERELLLYALHGVLHCLGEDDHDPAAHERMHAREDSILTALGVGATFDCGSPAGSAAAQIRTEAMRS